MPERASSASSLARPGSGFISLDQGTHAEIEIDPATMVVCKRFRAGDVEEAICLAQREYDYLLRYSNVLAQHRYVRCPEPLSCERGVLFMTFCRGVRLDDLLRTAPQSTVEDIPHIAAQVALALRQYVSEFGEPCYDLSFNNMIYEKETGTLSLLDFTVPHVMQQFDPDSGVFEVSLGALIGYSTFFTVRPRLWRYRQYWVVQKSLISAIMTELQRDQILDFTRISRVSDLAFASLAIRGSFGRKLYYGTVGTALYRLRRRSLMKPLENTPVPEAGRGP